MQFRTRRVVANASAFVVVVMALMTASAFAGEIKPYQAKPIEQYQAKPVEQYTARSVDSSTTAFSPPPGWTLSEQGAKGSIYKRGSCGLVFNELKPLNGSYEAAAEKYIDDAVKRLTDAGEHVVKMSASTTLEDTGAVTRAFATRNADTAYWHVRVVGHENGSLRPISFRCTDNEAFKESWPAAGRSIVGYLRGASAPAQKQRQDQGIHLLTQEEREAMMRNDTAAGRTRESMLSGRDNGNSSASTGGGGQLFLGTWYGANMLGQIDVHADGSYSSPNGARGSWQATGDRSLTFTSGPLTAWNGGRASISDKNALEFKWTTPQGQKQYFVYIRR